MPTGIPQRQPPHQPSHHNPAIPTLVNIAEEFVSRPAREHPDRVAILGEPREVTYSELADEVLRVAAALREWGCEPGERVLIVLPDSLEFIATFFGAARIGAIAVPVNPMARAGDYRHWLADSGARIGIVHSMALMEFSVAEAEKRMACVVVAGDAGSAHGVKNRVTWRDWVPAHTNDERMHATKAEDAAFFLYTSGSGGRPKAAVHRHQDMLVTSRAFAQGVLGLRPDDRVFSASKLFFAYGLGNGMYFPFSVGASTLLDPERARPERAADLVRRYRPTVFFAVPTLYAALVQKADRGAHFDFSSVRLAVSAGEALPAEIFERFKKKFSVEILDGIGSTEMLHMFLSNRPGEARAGTCGREVPGYEAKILDDKGAAAPTGEIGNLWVKGGSAFAEYWNIPELTAQTKRDGWVLTGDKFTRDAGGLYHYCGRADDMMKVAGMWVSPGEVENALLGHPLVAEAAVVGSADSLGFTRIAAHVVVREGVETGPHLAHKIGEWCQGELARYKCPQDIHIVAELPKTATGKIQRFRLRSGAV